MYACQELFGIQRGQEVHELVEQSTGAPCPCLSGKSCPLVAAAPTDLVLRPRLSA